jgi:hypothetical protein
MKDTDKEQIAIRIVRLREFHRTDRNEEFGELFRRLIEDPLKPKTDRGNLRVNPIVVLLAVMGLLAGGTFLFFSFVQL